MFTKLLLLLVASAFLRMILNCISYTKKKLRNLFDYKPRVFTANYK